MCKCAHACTLTLGDRCSLVQQGYDGEGGPLYSQDVALPAFSAQCSLPGGTPLLNHIKSRIKQDHFFSSMCMSHTTHVAISPPLLQLNRTQSSVAGWVEVLTGRRRLWALGELAAIESGYRQALELKHSYPQVFLSTNVPLQIYMSALGHGLIDVWTFRTLNITTHPYPWFCS